MRSTAMKTKFRLKRSIGIGITLLAALVGPAHAVPGFLDQTFGSFGTGGRIASDLGMGKVVLQTDGKIITAERDDQDRVSVIRYLSNGTLDPTFDGDGIAAYALPGVNPFINCMAVQPDGKILVGGVNGSPQNDFLVVRLNPTGALDASFGVNGFIYTDVFGNGFDSAYDLLVQPDGKIVAAGIWKDPNSDATQFAVVRYNANGSLDATFDGDGRRRIAYNTVSACSDVAIQSDGKLVLAGYTDYAPNDYDFAVMRLNTNGSLDNTFDGDGIVGTGIGGMDFAGSVAIQADGKIVVAGGNQPGGTANGEIVRYLTNGALDASFDGDGKRILTGLTGNAFECDVAIQPDGKILYLDSRVEANGNQKFALYRMSSSGALDTSLDGDGEALIDFDPLTSEHERGTCIALLPDGRIIVAGAGTQVYIARLWPDGSIDQGGHVSTDFLDALYDPNSLEMGYGMAIQIDGKIVVAGDISRADFTGRGFALARYLPDGQLDASFGDSWDPGRTTFGFGGQETATGVAIQPDGKIVTSGFVINGSTVDFMIARFNTDGTPDGSFGFGGFNVLDFLGGPDYALDLALAPDGKILVAGTVSNGTSAVFGVARFNSNGTVDNSFDGDGKQLVQFAVGQDHVCNTLVVQPDRKVVLGGQVGGNPALLRLDESGSLDGSFGAGGKVVIGLRTNGTINALALTSDGRYVGAGMLGSDFGLFCITSTGALYSGFGSNGLAFVDLGGTDEALAIDLRGDGVIAVAGASNSRFAVAQFLPNGERDTGFFGTGYNTTDLAGTSEAAKSIEFYGNTLVLAGYHSVNDHYNFALARFETTAGLVDVPVADAAAELSLVRLSPNPARAEARIEYELARASRVWIGVYDAQGRLMANPLDAVRPAGRNAITWTPAAAGGRVAAGIYFVRIEAAGRSATRRLVIVP
jgi:uncharacterized delta-60 repeat protein